jgi:hypothetical protein
VRSASTCRMVVRSRVTFPSLSIDENSLFEGSHGELKNPVEAPLVDPKGPRDDDMQSSVLAPYLQHVEASASTEWSR